MSPVVSESSNSPDRSFTVAKSGYPPSVVYLLNGRHRSQTGFRSGPLTNEDKEALAYADINHANQLSVIALQEPIEGDEFHPPAAVKHSSRAWPVHDRDYTQTRYRPTGFNLAYRSGYPQPTTNTSVQGCFGVYGMQGGYWPSLPSTSTLEGIAGTLLRNSRPPKRGFDLARFAAEQREAPLLWKASNYRPRTRKELGGAFLNYMFGIRPTGSDLGYLAELVLRTDGPVHSLLDYEKVREKKYGRKVLFSNSNSGEQIYTTSDTTAQGGTSALGFAKFKYYYLVKFGSTGSNPLWPIFHWSYTSKQLLKTFATWEYFVPQPHEIRGRLASYRRKAELILSSAKVDEGTVYDLTPWSWLLDWFVDIGGLIRYQRDCVDNQVVATGCGYSIWEEHTTLLHYSGLKLNPLYNGSYPYGTVSDIRFTGVSASVQIRKHTRRAGNPYSISPTWSLTSQQWAILGALGLTRGAGSPIKR